MIKSKSFEQQSKESEESKEPKEEKELPEENLKSREPERVEKLRKLQEKTQENKEKIKQHEEYIEEFYNSLVPKIEEGYQTKNLEEGEEKDKKGKEFLKFAATVGIMRNQYNLALEREKKELEKIRDQIEDIKSYCRNTLNIEPPNPD